MARDCAFIKLAEFIPSPPSAKSQWNSPNSRLLFLNTIKSSNVINLHSIFHRTSSRVKFPRQPLIRLRFIFYIYLPPTYPPNCHRQRLLHAPTKFLRENPPLSKEFLRPKTVTSSLSLSSSISSRGSERGREFSPGGESVMNKTWLDSFGRALEVVWLRESRTGRERNRRVAICIGQFRTVCFRACKKEMPGFRSVCTSTTRWRRLLHLLPLHL